MDELSQFLKRQFYLSMQHPCIGCSKEPVLRQSAPKRQELPKNCILPHSFSISLHRLSLMYFGTKKWSLSRLNSFIYLTVFVSRSQ